MNPASPESAKPLYNGIVLPEVWPPRGHDPASQAPLPVPYLDRPPAVIPIDVGRQLFVDDFLIESTSLNRVFEKPVMHPRSPVLSPTTDEELDGGMCPVAAPFNDGVWYDANDGLFKMWYMPGWFHSMALAVSRNGVVWERPDLDVVPGTNLVWAATGDYERDGGLVWLDHDAGDPAQRFKMFQYYRFTDPQTSKDRSVGWLHTSGDGIHWSAPVVTTPVGDNTSFFYNPFRRKWCMSIRRGWPLRVRTYRESDDFLDGATWDLNRDDVMWQRADRLDLPDPKLPDHTVALYDLNAVPYESLMLGLFAIFRGPENDICRERGVPKIIDLELGYSRDGFHFSRPDRTPFLASTRREGDWNRAYLHAAGGLCLVAGDQLLFYVTGFSGISPSLDRHATGSPGRVRNVMYAGASVGLATLRRDGFAAMTADATGGELTTRPLRFKGDRLFVNAAASAGELRVSVLDADANPLPGLDAARCVPIRSDSTCAEVTWAPAVDLGRYAGSPIRLRFHLRTGQLYAFWVTDDPKGSSYGYMAAGGPGSPNGRDVPCC